MIVNCQCCCKLLQCLSAIWMCSQRDQLVSQFPNLHSLVDGNHFGMMWSGGPYLPAAIATVSWSSSALAQVEWCDETISVTLASASQPHVQQLSASVAALKMQRSGTRCIAAYMSPGVLYNLGTGRCELMIPRNITRPSIARSKEQLDLLCTMQTYHHPKQPHQAFTPVTNKLLLIFHPAEGRRLSWPDHTVG